MTTPHAADNNNAIPNLAIRRGRHQVVREIKLGAFEPSGFSHDAAQPALSRRRPPCRLRERTRRGGRGVRDPGPALEPLNATEIRNSLPELSHLRDGPLVEVRPAGMDILVV